MEEFSTEKSMPKQRTAASSSSYRSPCDLVERAISAVLKCLGSAPSCWLFSKRGEDTKKHQNASYDPSPSIEEESQFDPPSSVSERGMKTDEDVAVNSIRVRGRRPKQPPISSGGDPQHN